MDCIGCKISNFAGDRAGLMMYVIAAYDILNGIKREDRLCTWHREMFVELAQKAKETQ